MLRAILILFLLLYTFNLQSQTCGCTDPQAINYNPQANCNDGSCRYKSTEYTVDNVAELPNDLKEISGIIYIGQHIWGMNDGGNEPILYKIDPSNGQIIQRVRVNSKNKDWEDLAQDNKNIYIGDFGNNAGSREKLRIYIVDKSQLSDTMVETQTIDFNYPDQKDFTKRNREHNFDCEAFFCWNDTLHLFSKNWINKWTKHYTVPAHKGNYTAQLVDSFDAGLLVTAADVSPDGKWVGLCGYDKLGNIGMWLLYGYQESNFTKGNKRYISLGSALVSGQMEGLAIMDSVNLFLSSENFKGLAKQQLNYLKVSPFIDPTEAYYISQSAFEDVKVSYNSLQGIVNLELTAHKPLRVDCYIIDPKGKVRYNSKLELAAMGYKQFKFETGKLPRGNYLLVLANGATVLTKQKLRNLE